MRRGQTRKATTKPPLATTTKKTCHKLAARAQHGRKGCGSSTGAASCCTGAHLTRAPPPSQCKRAPLALTTTSVNEASTRTTLTSTVTCKLANENSYEAYGNKNRNDTRNFEESTVISNIEQTATAAAAAAAATKSSGFSRALLGSSCSFLPTCISKIKLPQVKEEEEKSPEQGAASKEGPPEKATRRARRIGCLVARAAGNRQQAPIYTNRLNPCPAQLRCCAAPPLKTVQSSLTLLVFLLASLLLKAYNYYLLSFKLCDTPKPRQDFWRKVTQPINCAGSRRIRSSRRVSLGVLALTLLVWSRASFWHDGLLQASAAQLVPATSTPASTSGSQQQLFAATTGGEGATRTTRTEELKSAVLATMLATQSTLAELNSSLPRPHFLPATAAQADLSPASSGDMNTENELGAENTLAPLELDAMGASEGSARAAATADDESLVESLYEQQQQQQQRQSSNMVPAHYATNNTHNGDQDAQQPPADMFESVLNFCRIFIMGAIIVGDICGNSLVILSVCRHSKLRVTTNWFVVSLACADILVALFAMTFNASVIIWGRWLFKPWVCDFWNSCDVLASTASILHLCCISIDRYIAIMRPLDYPMKITTKRVMYALCAVWISSALLSYIPIFTGIYTTSEHIQWLKDNPDQCEFVVNRVYAIVSSSISFWIPCCIMVFTYYRIYREASRQEKFIYKAQSMMPAPMANHHNHHAKSKQRRSKSMAVVSHHGGGAGAGGSSGSAGGSGAVAAQANERIKSLANKTTTTTTTMAGNNSTGEIATTELGVSAPTASLPQVSIASESEPLTANTLDRNNNSGGGGSEDNTATSAKPPLAPGSSQRAMQKSKQKQQQKQQQQQEDEDDRDSNSGQSTPTKRSISKMKREHKAAKTLGIIMASLYSAGCHSSLGIRRSIFAGKACDGMLPRSAVTLLFWIGYFNSTLNPIIYAYFNHEFRDAFKKTLQWIFCCCQDLKCLRVNRPNDNQHYNCTYRSTQEIGLVTNG